MVQIYDTCTHFICTIPLHQPDPYDVEDIDTTLEDHVYYQACHIFVPRAITPKLKPRKKSTYEKRSKRLYLGNVDSYEYVAKIVQEQAFRDLGVSRLGCRFAEYDESRQYDDPCGPSPNFVFCRLGGDSIISRSSCLLCCTNAT